MQTGQKVVLSVLILFSLIPLYLHSIHGIIENVGQYQNISAYTTNPIKQDSERDRLSSSIQDNSNQSQVMKNPTPKHPQERPQLKLSDVKQNKVITVEKMREVHRNGMKVLKDKANIMHPGFGGVQRPWLRIEKNLRFSLDSVLMSRKQVPESRRFTRLLDSWKAAYGRLSRIKAQTPIIRYRNGEVALTKNGKLKNVVIYNRVPKCGSTTMTSLIYKLRKRNNYLALITVSGAYYHLSKPDQRSLGYFFKAANERAKTMYIKHQYFVNFNQTNMPQPMYVNLMRDPVEFFISNYVFTRTQSAMSIPVDIMTPEAKRIMLQSLEECVVKEKRECVYGGQTLVRDKNFINQERWIDKMFLPNDQLLYFCGTDPECSRLGDPRALQKAKHNVETHYVVVGLLEYMNVTAAVFEHMLPGWFTGLSKMVDDLGQENKNSVKKDMVVDESIKEILRHRFKDLYDLYDFIKQKLFRQYRQFQQS